MWLRRMLVSAYDLAERAAHTPHEVNWDELPERVVLQLHWHSTPAFQQLLRRHGFRVLVLARHPLDTLVSILHFAQHEPATARWLEGEHGDERVILGADPCSPAFLAYARSPRARSLLAVSLEWWDEPLVAWHTRYRDLVHRPFEELQRLERAIGVPIAGDTEQVLEAASFERLKAEAANHHAWRGKPDHWRTLIPSEVALEIGAFHQRCFEQFGFELHPDPLLSAEAAIAAWQQIAAPRDSPSRP